MSGTKFIKKHPIVIILLTILVAFTGIHIFYYEHTGSPELLAEKLVEKNRKAEDCFLFRTFDIMFRPTTYEMQMRCVRKYAKLTKDPTACELLLPSNYTMSCIGAATIESHPCFIKKDKTVRWNNHGGESSLEECMEKDPISQKGKDCCLITKVNFLSEYDDCTLLANRIDMSDQCYKELADKKLDESICANVKDNNLRSACYVRAKALVKYPSLR